MSFTGRPRVSAFAATTIAAEDAIIAGCAR